MANECYYRMKVKGTKENVEEFIKVMQSDYSYQTMDFDFERHMGARVFEANTDEIRERADGLYETEIDGDCAWSVYSCMFDGNFTYYKDLKARHGEECRSTTVPLESERLNLEIEIYSEECGCCFQEHYLVRNGMVEIDDCVDYHEFCLDDYDAKEDAEDDFEIGITDEEWEYGGYISRGGFENWDFVI